MEINFRPSLVDFVQALLLGRIKEEEIAREALAQIEKLQRAGINPTHIDTHKHTHLFPAIARPLLQVAERCGIRAIRNPFESGWSLALDHGSLARRLAVRLIGCLRPRFEAHPQLATAASSPPTAPSPSLPPASSTPQPSPRLCARFRLTGTYELCCHPGYNDGELDRVTTRLRAHRDIEREALLSEIPRVLAGPNAPLLLHYGSLAAK